MTLNHLPIVRRLMEASTDLEEEEIQVMVEGGSFRLERIVSNGAISPEGFWYDQDHAEWVAVVQGSATLEFESGRLDLRCGDALMIPSGLRHRVTYTSADCVWLALHHEGALKTPKAWS